jgi:hypothetical protein
MNLASALDSLDTLIASIEDRAGLSSPATRARKSGLCWTGHWASRKSRLTAGNTAAPTGLCYYQFQVRKRRKKWVH